MPEKARPNSPRIKRRLIIAIDGPAGSGKSTTAKALARRLRIPYIDSGAMYRALTLAAVEKKVSFRDKPALVRLAKQCEIGLEADPGRAQRVFLDGKDVTRRIRLPELTSKVFAVAQIPAIRRELVGKQRRLGLRRGGVMEGRDIGTVVFPGADYKFFFVAKEAIRAKRRHRELLASGARAGFSRVLRDMQKRDRTDRTRREGPLKRAKDAVLIDTTSLTISQTVDRILRFLAHAR
ncbi:MAG: (d)CMP kinase [Candidatus Omnitrophica bacterium]|nr:(d)CMP kinase [Candidatus Omnitrophota bacterium]